jgi:hypothetical protein
MPYLKWETKASGTGEVQASKLLDKMMIRFTRKENGLGAIVQLQSQEWSSKPITEDLMTQGPELYRIHCWRTSAFGLR